MYIYIYAIYAHINKLYVYIFYTMYILYWYHMVYDENKPQASGSSWSTPLSGADVGVDVGTGCP